MKKTLFTLLFFIGFASIGFSQEQEIGKRKLQSINGKSTFWQTIHNPLMGNNLVLKFENSYLIKKNNDSLIVSVLEIERYIIGKNPTFSVDIDNTKEAFVLNRKGSLYKPTKDPYLIISGNPYDFQKAFWIKTIDTTSLFRKDSIDLNLKRPKNRHNRKTFINAIYKYGDTHVNHFYFFGNFSPSYSYRRLVSAEPYASEYYNQAYLAEQKDKGMTFPTLNNDANTSYHLYKNANFGFGFSRGTGHSFFASYNQFQKGYSLYYGKNDTAFKHHIINNSGLFIGYRYQRIHRYYPVMPVVEVSYGWVSGPKNNVYKLATGVSSMLWSKNLYLNVVPYYMGSFRSQNNYTDIKGLNARIYNIGIDVGIVYKLWRF